MELRYINILVFFLREELKEVPNNKEWERIQKEIDMLLLKAAFIKKFSKDEKCIFRLGC